MFLGKFNLMTLYHDILSYLDDQPVFRKLYLGFTAFIIFWSAAATLSGCSWFGSVSRDEFDALSGRVSKIENVVYRSPNAQPHPGAVNGGLRTNGPIDPAFQAAFPEAPSAGARTSSSEKNRYSRAQALLKAKRYQEAASAFIAQLQDFPNGRLAPNARYWLGECHYARGDYAGAMSEFRQGLWDYPNSNKAADYLLKISYCQSRLGDGPGAMNSLRQLLSAYPDSDSAKLVRSGRSRFANGF